MSEVDIAFRVKQPIVLSHSPLQGESILPTEKMTLA